ncbi:arsenite efflux transporter metallochaperone ArsD [Oscillospiraceae bacterium LTW-04]|nr:arsenite efflux transporter metallochaperone ArsD [Oscillospiraceae bacterium MB24-C1]
MKSVQIFEPAMCCPTGLCGVGVDPELLRMSTVLNSLKKQGVIIDRFNLNSAPMEFVNNKTVNNFISSKGVAGLPVTLVDGKIVISGRYPTNQELIKILNIPLGFLGQSHTSKFKVTPKRQGGGSCSGGNC